MEACRINVPGVNEKWRAGLKVVFRVDASLQMGTGHVMRCLTLAQVLKDNSAKVEFICRKHEGSLINKIHSSGFVVHELEVFKETEVDNKLAHSHWLGATQQQDTDDCINILKAEKIDWLIVDHYALDEQWQKRLKPCYEKLMVIDDLADRQFDCDILLDQTYGRQKEDYLPLAPKKCKLLLGSQYALIRPEFSKWRNYSLNRRINPKFNRILVNMGGVDTGNITGKVVKELQACALPKDIVIVIVIGKGFPYLEDIQLIVESMPYKSEIKVDVDNMAEIMADSDIAIGASGSTTWERCCLGLPTIQLLIAKNQETAFKLLLRDGIIKPVYTIENLSKNIYELAFEMKAFSVASSKVCDGQGPIHVMKYLNSIIK